MSQKLAVHQGIEIDVVDLPGAVGSAGVKRNCTDVVSSGSAPLSMPDRCRRLPVGPGGDVADVGELEQLGDDREQPADAAVVDHLHLQLRRRRSVVGREEAHLAREEG